MFECTIWITLPLTNVADGNKGDPSFQKIATFNFDPNLQVGDEFHISDWILGANGKFNFSAKAGVAKREIFIKPANPNQKNALFELRIIAEILDKEQIPEVCSILKELNPGIFME
jgi:hypothetical protein